ncbi:MAG: carboxypeptidase-like regulatory domain-containing protein [Dysgonamonadaceae bacterium]|nr:carboxypeptidase-like regulatory domain-containing protein [Dysgonamonadaceae bacterium]MDD4728195.1 carboxypeptidase-like regulatory domain-containing protein [Dysgonamonadaceae bacterium]
MNKVVLLLSLSFLCAFGFAQKNVPSVFLIETDSEIVAKNDDLVPLTIQLKNGSTSPFDGKIEIQTIEGIQLIGQTVNAIHIDGNAKMFIPVRISISKSVPAGKTDIMFKLIDNNNITKAQFITTLIVNPKRQVQLSAQNANELMQHVGDSLTVSARLSNQGNSNENIIVTASFPDMRGGKKVEKKQIVLGSFQDTIITFSKIITKELLSVERYTVNMAALYENGELINNIMVTVQNVSGNRTFTDAAFGYSFDSYSSNSISLSGINLFSQNEALQLNAKGQYELLNGNLDFNLDGYFYTHGNTRPLLTNTYIDYKSNNKGIRVGNISENLETFVNGRGVKTYIENEAKSKLFEVGWVDKSYNLLGNQYKSENGTGYTIYAKTELNTVKEGRYAGSVLYDQTPYDNSENVIVMNELNFQMAKDITVGFELGGGLTRLLNADQNQSSIEPSVAMGYKMSAKFGNYSFNSNNFISSGYYPGVRRGVLQLNERISRQFRKMSLWAGYSLYNYSPQYLEKRYYGYSSNLSNSRIEAGTNFPLSNQMSLGLSAKKQKDQGAIGFSQNNDNAKTTMNAYSLTESINWRSRNSQHTMNLSAENGFTKIASATKQQFQLRLNANYNYRIFSLNSYYQKGNFSIYEAYLNAMNDESNYRFNVSGGVRKEFFGKKLKTQLDVNYNRDSYSGSNWTYSGRVDYAISHQFSCFANAYVYDYSSSAYSSFNTNLQAGVRYNLPSKGALSGGKKGNLKLFLYYDNNANGIYDEGDTPAKDRIISIGGVSFISLGNGIVEYKKMPYGNYTIKFPSQDWYAIIPSSINIEDKRTVHEVPLQRTGKVVGKLYYNYDARTSEKFAEKHGGLRVWATAKNGKKTEALTNANGEFTLFLPVGEYEFSVDASSLPKNVYTDFEPQEIKVITDKPTAIPDVELKIKQRVIEMKRFGL